LMTNGFEIWQKTKKEQWLTFIRDEFLGNLGILGDRDR
jgi:hypothetical protein